MTNVLAISAALALLILLPSCNNPSEKRRNSWIEEIRKTEEAFCEMAGTDGIGPAFVAFADDEAALLRGDKVIKGKNAIKSHYANSSSGDVKLIWEPEFINISENGDLAYTYGPYTYSSKDTSGQWTESHGIFHTVWKRQTDGSWKYVWD